MCIGNQNHDDMHYSQYMDTIANITEIHLDLWNPGHQLL